MMTDVQYDFNVNNQYPGNYYHNYPGYSPNNQIPHVQLPELDLRVIDDVLRTVDTTVPQPIRQHFDPYGTPETSSSSYSNDYIPQQQIYRQQQQQPQQPQQQQPQQQHQQQQQPQQHRQQHNHQQQQPPVQQQQPPLLQQQLQQQPPLQHQHIYNNHHQRQPQQIQQQQPETQLHKQQQQQDVNKVNTDHMTPEELKAHQKLMRRREVNRIAQHKSRERQLAKFEEAQAELKMIREQQKELKEYVSLLESVHTEHSDMLDTLNMPIVEIFRRRLPPPEQLDGKAHQLINNAIQALEEAVQYLNI